MPISLNVAGCIFLALTLQTTNKRRTPVWKSSTLAPLHHGLGEKETEVTVREVSQMDKLAKSTFIQLMNSDENDRYMFRTNSQSGEARGVTTGIALPQLLLPKKALSINTDEISLISQESHDRCFQTGGHLIAKPAVIVENYNHQLLVCLAYSL